MQENNSTHITALDIYIRKIYKFLIIAPPAVAIFSAISYTVSYMRGTYRSVPLAGLIAFDVTNLIYVALGCYFLFTGIDKDGFVNRRKFALHKIFVSAGIIIQWNFTAYLIPSKDFWAWAPFFALFGVFFFDTKIMKAVIAGLTFSTFLSYFLKPLLFVERGEYFVADVGFRISHTLFSMAFIYAIVYFGEKYLIDELQRYANFDPLTKLLNRRCLDSYMQNAYKKARKNNEPFSVLLMDIDDFKKVNDTYGHDCGDEILKFVALEVSTGVSSEDIVFRWGGEEIFVILKAEKKQAIQIAERIRSTIERATIKYKGTTPVSVTVTIGVATYEDGDTIQSLFDDVDDRLYYGKKHGKNRVVSITSE